MFISSDKTKILVDAGLSGKKIDLALDKIDQNPNELDGIFITHEHSDHIKGVGILSRKYDIPIFANADTWSAMKDQLGKIKEENIKVIGKRSVTEIKDMNILSFNIPHDAAAPMGYTITDGKKSVSIATDLGTFTNEIFENTKDSDVVLLESNHDVNMLKFGPYPYPLKTRILSEIGHLSNDDCGNAVVDLLKVKENRRIILGHLSKTNNQPDLAYATVANILNENGIDHKQDIKLTMADRYNPSQYIEM